MSAAAVRLMATGRVPAMCAAILFTGGFRTFARCVSAFFSRLGVVHFYPPILLILLLSSEAFNGPSRAAQHLFSHIECFSQNSGPHLSAVVGVGKHDQSSLGFR